MNCNILKTARRKKFKVGENAFVAFPNTLVNNENLSKYFATLWQMSNRKAATILQSTVTLYHQIEIIKSLLYPSYYVEASNELAEPIYSTSSCLDSTDSI